MNQLYVGKVVGCSCKPKELYVRLESGDVVTVVPTQSFGGAVWSIVENGDTVEVRNRSQYLDYQVWTLENKLQSLAMVHA